MLNAFTVVFTERSVVPLTAAERLSLLSAAVREGNLDEVRRLAPHVAPSKRPTVLGHVLIEALQHPTSTSPMIVEALLNAQANPNIGQIEANGTTVFPLDLALQAATVNPWMWEVVGRLLDGGACPQNMRAAATGLAMLAGHAQVDLMVRWHAIFLDNIDWSNGVVHQAAQETFQSWTSQPSSATPAQTSAQRIAVVDAFLAMGYGLNEALHFQRNDQRRLLHHAIVLNDAPLLQHVLAAGAILCNSFEIIPAVPPCTSDLGHRWVPPLHLAIHLNQREVIEVLLDHGLRIDAPVHQDLGTPEHHARTMGLHHAQVTLESHVLRTAMGTSPKTIERSRVRL